MKKITAFLFLIATSLSLVACNETGISSSDDSTQEEIKLNFWHGFTGTDGDNMASIVNSFNNEYKGKIKVEVTRLDWDTLFTKFYQNKRNPKYSPNIVAIGANRLGAVLKQDMLVEMNDIMDTLNLSKDDFVSSAYDIGLVNNTRYSFPLDVHPTCIFYNKDITGNLSQYNTWDDFYNACLEFTKDDVFGWAIPNGYSITKDIFYSQLLQNGGDILTNNEPTFNSQKGISILSKLVDLKYGSNPISSSTVSNGGDLTLFKAGKSAFYFDGPWMINTLLNSCDFAADGNLGVMAMPQSTGENGISFAGSHQLCLAKNTVKDDKTRQASYTFINYLSTNALEWAKAGQVPARISVHESTEFKNLTYLAPFVQEAYKANIGSSYSYFYEVYNYMGSAVSSALNNEKSAENSLNEKTNNFKRWLAEQ